MSNIMNREMPDDVLALKEAEEHEKYYEDKELAKQVMTPTEMQKEILRLKEVIEDKDREISFLKDALTEAQRLVESYEGMVRRAQDLAEACLDAREKNLGR